MARDVRTDSYDDVAADPEGAAHFTDLTPEEARSVDEFCDFFEHQLYSQGRPRIEDLVGHQAEPVRSILLRELLYLEVECAIACDTTPDRERYCRRFPEHQPIVREVFALLVPDAKLAVTREDDQPALIGQYRILKPLNQGGMGRVFTAMHPRLGRIVAIKVLHAELARDIEAEAAFDREMKIVGNLLHPCIVQALDAGKWDAETPDVGAGDAASGHASRCGGTHFLVMEYVVGFDLGEILQRVGPLRVADACEIARRVASALEYARAHNLVHRDIKPKNVLLGRGAPSETEVQVKVVDFGLALLRGYPSKLDGRTKVSEVAGTFTYMAPEQYWEQASDIRSDLYGLGCTLYCLLVGRPPFSPQHYPNTHALMTAHRDAPIPNLRRWRPDVTAALEELVTQLLAKRPDDRPAVPADVERRLASFTAGYDFGGLLAQADANPFVPLANPPPANLVEALAKPRHSPDDDQASHPAERSGDSASPTIDYPGSVAAIEPSARASPRRESSKRPSSKRQSSKRPSSETPRKTPTEALSDATSGVSSGAPIDASSGTPSGASSGASYQASSGATSDAASDVKSRVDDAAAPATSGEPGTPSRRSALVVGLTGGGLLFGVATLGAIWKWGVGRPRSASSSIDLLALIQPMRDARQGEWRLEGGQLTSPEVPLARLEVPVDPPPSYKLEVAAERRRGGRLVIGLVWEGRSIPVVLDAVVVAAGHGADRTPSAATTALIKAWRFTGGRPGAWTCLVGAPGVLVAFGADVLLTMSPHTEVALRPEWSPAGPPRLFIGTHNSVYDIHYFRLTPI